MSLEEYRRKRDFRKTPEPSGARRKAPRPGDGLNFVIQKHAARRLHYDFRLELDGVLKSWAVPKGPSLDPGEKRLAVHVEDHPLEYGGFEGIIPEGQYGGGTVMLWDRGSWRPLDADPAAAYAKGALKFVLDGEKLHGAWALVRMGRRAAGEKHENWLLIKERDAEAQPGSGAAVVEEHEESVTSGRDIDAIARDADRVWDGTRGEVPAAPHAPDPSRIDRARRKRLAATIAPQLATLTTATPEGEEWLHEIKFDGYRILARVAGGKAVLLTRNGLDWTAKFPELAAALARLPVEEAVLDGELVHLEADGRTSFSGLQQALSDRRTASLVFFAFDLLHLDGYDLTPARLDARKEALSRLLGGATQGMIRYSDHQLGSGPAFLRQACGMSLEGIVSKRADAPYRGGRSRAWLKVKCGNQQEFVVVGFSDPAGARTGFGALLLGAYDSSGELRYVGRVGTGFDERLLASLHGRLKGIAVATAPVAKLPKGVSTRDVHWVRPALVAEIRFTDWTRDHLLRQAVFLGLREDKDPREVGLDPAEGAAAPEAASARPDPPVAWDGSATIAGARLTNAAKVLYPGENITKRDLAAYYEAVAEHALPHLAGRPLALVRCPEGVSGECFFQKHLSRGMPEAIRHVEIADGDGRESVLYIDDAAGLIALVQMGVLEIHPWGAPKERPDRPDRLIFDLDPDVGLPWQRVIEAAVLVRDTLAGLGLRSFAKTTGGKGLHVVVPIAPRLSWEDAKAFTKAVAEHLAAAAPDRYTAHLPKRSRHGKIFIDYLRNARGATAVGAFSTRSRPGCPVSTPVGWEEIADGVRPDGFTYATVPQRLAQLRSDPWEGFFALKQSVTAAARRKLGS